MNTIEEIAGVLKKLKSAVIFTHMRPDGDTIGSALALSRALSMRGTACEVVCESEIPARYLFLADVGTIRRAPENAAAEGYICVDASDEARLGALEPLFRANAVKKVTVNVDHHISNTRYCRYNFVRERASNCENIAELIRALGVEPDTETARCLMLGMVTDSGVFSHGDVTGDTFREAALCADRGAKVGEIVYEAVKRQSKARAAMYAEVISKLRWMLGDAFAAAVVTRETLERYGLATDATEGIVDFALTVESVEVSACLLETKKGQYKVSLRSKGTVNVNEIARRFGGGGHVLASGCMLFGELEEVLDTLRYTVSQHLGS